MAEVRYAKVEWAPEDVRSVLPNLTREAAEDFLDRNEKHLRDRLIERGHEVIAELAECEAGETGDDAAGGGGGDPDPDSGVGVFHYLEGYADDDG